MTISIKMRKLSGCRPCGNSTNVLLNEKVWCISVFSFMHVKRNSSKTVNEKIQIFPHKTHVKVSCCVQVVTTEAGDLLWRGKY